jgi:nucleotide-binding universal stress UspA family protein
MDRGESSEPNPSSTGGILVASTGEPFERSVLDRAVELARGGGSKAVHVISTARVYGTALGLQHPGLFPSKREWDAQAGIVAEAVRILKKAGLDAKGRVVGTRHPSKVINKEAIAKGCRAIVIGTRPVARWRKLLWQDDVHMLARSAAVPVHVVMLPDRDLAARRQAGRSQ